MEFSSVEPRFATHLLNVNEHPNDSNHKSRKDKQKCHRMTQCKGNDATCSSDCHSDACDFEAHPPPLQDMLCRFFAHAF
jgi:hypothetical protein